jgi:hypothetical protein
MVYAVPLTDGTYGYVQAVSAAMVNVIDVAVFSTRSTSLPKAAPKLDRSDVISLSATWRQDLNSGEWAALGVATLVVAAREMPNHAVLASGTTVGIKHSDAGLIGDLLNAWHGLAPWNVMFDEAYFDSILAPGVRRPSNAIVLAPTEREAFRAREATNGA